jgi:mono/diheme cytochrome c family protein
MNFFLKTLKWLLISLLILVICLFAFVQLKWKKVHEAPLTELVASTDSSIIAQGAYLAYGAAHCASCHIPLDKLKLVESGVNLPMSGGRSIEIAGLGILHSPNITPDKETGIGNWTDAELVRALRHGVAKDGSMLFPIMPFQELSEQDMIAIISFLRSQEPINNQVKETEYGFMGKALLAGGILKPVGPLNTPPKEIKKEATIDYGKYLAHSVANCVGCHTNRDLQKNIQIGESFAGGLTFPVESSSQGKSFVSPNLTPDPKTGVMFSWNEEQFKTRIRKGEIHGGTPMPWGSFSRLDDVDLEALYAYLKSLKPVENKIEKTVIIASSK